MNPFPTQFVATVGRLRAALLILALPIVAFAAPATAPDQLPAAFRDAWNRHDGHALAEFMSDDIDFVNVGAVMLHGRADFETVHTRLLTRLPLLGPLFDYFRGFACDNSLASRDRLAPKGV